MVKRKSWKKEHQEELKFFYKRIFYYYFDLQNEKEFRILGYIPIVLTREYTDFLFKTNLFKKVKDSHQHHIIPRKCGGDDDSRNLIWLTKNDHCTAHSILYSANMKNVTIRCAATMLRTHAKKRKNLTAGEHRKDATSFESFRNLYGENSYSWDD